MRLTAAAPLIALVAFAGARFAKGAAKDLETERIAESPYAPSAGAAPIVALGYRELAADLLFVRMVGYFGSPDNDAAGLADLAEAIVALDPSFKRTYEFGAVAMTSAKRGVDNAVRLRAIALLEQAGRVFPESWKYPKLAGEIYIADLTTDDPKQKAIWRDRGAMLFETATRKPNAPADMSMVAASLRTKLGQHQRAIDSLREMLLITNDTNARARILDQLEKLSNEDRDELASELLIARQRFEQHWHAERPVLKPSMYILIGPPLPHGFDLGDLATGGQNVVGSTDSDE